MQIAGEEIERLRRQIMEQIDLTRTVEDEEVYQLIEAQVRDFARERMLTLGEREAVVQTLFYSLRKLDVLQELLEDPTITEIMVNGAEHIFHETKNYTMGEGGTININRAEYVERGEILREKGTNRTKFFRGEVDKYSWVDVGSSYLPSEMNAAYLYAQLEQADEINNKRLALWNQYYSGLEDLQKKGYLQLPYIPEECGHNAHMFYIKVKDLKERTRLSSYLRERGIYAVFHYVPLHSSAAGQMYGEFVGEDRYTTKESERLLRLPMFYALKPELCDYIIECIRGYWTGSKAE